MKASIFMRRVALLSLAGALLALTGCNTVAGFGQDISSSARTVQRAL
ncbi:lipoprotein [Paraburkholderia dinghuensis]|uniref:Entericidin A/B family lipoprotein n=1 Tax=Paraburkholderia dinghuensis TaxID=2305225 RepID=A0A3N6N9D9_9BURK|nr:lipoprotein [Paraburkholderia dinghuensis]RQH05652.1 entericidin A/B family lipoprotein [Paraburkholderia dinghuensis]